MTHATSMLPNLDHFDCEGDPTSVGARWERWKRALEIYLVAANIESSEKKLATLLHVGGLPIQDVYYNLPAADSHNSTSDLDVYKEALGKLDNYFSPKQSCVYERYLYRLIKQEQGEQFEKFLLRLRNQADKCKFIDKDTHLIDQITEKCSSTDLRKKILEGGDSFTLDAIIAKANALEAVTRQLEHFNHPNQPVDCNNKSEVNKINVKNKNNKISKKTEFSNTQCTRCGKKNHSSDDIKCPARDKRCIKCGFIGHFKEFCRTRQKRRFENNNNTERTNKRSKAGSEKNEEECEIDYVF